MPKVDGSIPINVWVAFGTWQRGRCRQCDRVYIVFCVRILHISRKQYANANVRMCLYMYICTFICVT